MRRIRLSPQRRDLFAAVTLLALLVIALPLIGSLLGNWFAPSAAGPQAALDATMTPAARTTTIETPPPPEVTATLPATPTFVPLPPGTRPATPPARVYLVPFRQVFAIGQPQPAPVTPALLYENGSDIFQVMDRQAGYVRLQTSDARMNFWTGAENISPSPPAAPQYDFTVRGKTAQLANATGLACMHELNSNPPFSICQPLSNFPTATLTARIFSSSSLLYLADIGGKPYYLLPGVGFTFS
ncbi:MAG TPA: hypothetical protein VF932_07935 [Anaerolineae bacterium]